MYVIGTAGHVDHGKSTLVKALTGIDPDRLKEEKERQMTLDLGFAWLLLPNGEEVGVVDVPGHERLVKNMLAGVGGVDLAMLIVAADEGVMPQTREHLAILDLLRVERGLVVLTKKDLVDDDWLELVGADVREALEGSAFEGAPMIAASAMTGEGLDELKQTIAELLAETEPRKDLGRPRLPIDRSFVMPGFGAVVTGTLSDGSFSVGQEVELVPKGLRGRIRGLQTHRKKLNEAGPGRRLAVNISGIGHEEVSRGDVVAAPGWLAATAAVDARVRMVKDAPAPLKHNATVLFHTGTSETPARFRLLENDELGPGETELAQLKFQRPVALVKGDLFILRNSWGTVGGGEIIEPRAKRHRRFDEGVIGRLEVLEAGSPDELVMEAIAAKEPRQVKSLPDTVNMSAAEVEAVVGRLVASGDVVHLGSGALGPASHVHTEHGLARRGRALAGLLGDFHTRYPARRGMAKEEVRSRLNLNPAQFGLVLDALRARGDAAERGSLLHLPGREPSVSPPQQAQINAYLAALASSPYSPPPEAKLDPELVNYLLDEGKVVRAAPDVVFATAAFEEMRGRVVARLQEEGTITVGQVRDMFGSSRKYVLAFLEYLDQSRVTRRQGDERVLR